MINQPAATRYESRIRRSRDRGSQCGERKGVDEATTHLSSASFVMLEYAAERFMTNDRLAAVERVVDLRPRPAERPVVEALVRAPAVVELGVARDKMVKMLLTWG